MNADALCVIPTCADCLPWTNIANMSTSMLAYKHVPTINGLLTSLGQI